MELRSQVFRAPGCVGEGGVQRLAVIELGDRLLENQLVEVAWILPTLRLHTYDSLPQHVRVQKGQKVRCFGFPVPAADLPVDDRHLDLFAE